MRLVPLTEGSGIDFNDGTLDQGLGSEQLVVGGVVDLVAKKDEHPRWANVPAYRYSQRQ